MENKGKVILVGSINMDLVTYAPKFPQSGETIFGSSFSTAFGGKGSNQAFMAAQILNQENESVKFIGCVGDDDFGKRCVNNLSQNMVDTTLIQTSKSETGVAVITVTPETNQIIVVPGANHQLFPEAVQQNISHIQNASVMVCQFEVLTETNLTALKLAKSHDVITIVNPAPCPQKGEFPIEILDYTDILCPNEVEISILSGIPVTDYPSAERACQAVTETHTKPMTIIVTLGPLGALIFDHRHRGSPPKVTTVPAQSVNPVDTTGAGDCFIGTFAAFLSRGFSFEEATAAGVQMASRSVQKKGAQSSYPTSKELASLMNKSE